MILSADQPDQDEKRSVYVGLDPKDQDVVLHLSSHGVGALYATPYWRSAPWPQVITDTMEYALNGNGESMWVQGARIMGYTDITEPPLTDLPIPDLTRWAERIRGRDRWGERYLEARKRWKADAGG